MWVVSIYMYITLSCIRRSTALNIPVYEYGMSFHLLVSSFFQQCPMVFSAQIFHFLRSLLHYLVWVIWVRDGEDGLKKRGNVLPPLCSYPMVTCSTSVQGHALHLCLQVSPLLWIFFESECSPYYWNVHKHSPNAWPVSKRPRYTYIWMSISDHQIFCNKEKPESSSVSFPYLWNF